MSGTGYGKYCRNGADSAPLNESKRTISHDGNSCSLSGWPCLQNLSDVSLIFNGDIETLWTTPNVRVVGARIPNLHEPIQHLKLTGVTE